MGTEEWSKKLQMLKRGVGMRASLSARKEQIAEYVRQYYLQHDRLPSERDIVKGTGIPAGSVHRYLVEWKESGDFLYEGRRRSARTEDLDHVSPKHILRVLGTVACGPGQEEEERFIEYIHMPECMVGKGECFALIAKGESMIGAGVHPGDYVIVRRQKTARPGDLVIALSDGKNNLKKLLPDEKERRFILRSCNPDREAYPDIIVDELEIQGVAIGVYHSFDGGDGSFPGD